MKVDVRENTDPAPRPRPSFSPSPLSEDRHGSAAIGWPAAAAATVEFIYLLNAPFMNRLWRRVVRSRRSLNEKRDERGK